MQISARGTVASGTVTVKAIGTGNYSGESREEKELPIKIELELEQEGRAVSDALASDRDGRVSFTGRVVSNVPIEGNNQLKVSVNNEEKPVSSDYSFSVENLELPEDGAVSVVVTLNGDSVLEQTISVRDVNGIFLWTVLAVALAAAAAICLVISIKLKRKVKDEKYKLLDKSTRQSSRTIRNEIK